MTSGQVTKFRKVEEKLTIAQARQVTADVVILLECAESVEDTSMNCLCRIGGVVWKRVYLSKHGGCHTSILSTTWY